MSIRTFEGIVEKGQIKLTSPITLLDQTKVYIIVSDAEIEQTAHVHTPRLAKPEQVSDFEMEVVEYFS